jgi:hypothetical protein
MDLLEFIYSKSWNNLEILNLTIDLSKRKNLEFYIDHIQELHSNVFNGLDCLELIELEYKQIKELHPIWFVKFKRYMFQL